ncbi:MAG TPA: TlpA disulfide reductase family protein [Solirubrobacteraceae bacterium]|jgi:peroxiredoxin|nr:TlpA disulfide reductase family protein [Solirubrobacteraceae bacterium]
MSDEGPLSFDDEEAPRQRRGEEAAGPAGADVPPPARPPTRRYGWIVGVIGLLLIAYVTLNTIRTQSREAPQEGKQLPAFATPLALSSLNGDANVARHAGSGASGKRPACEVRGDNVFNVCDLAARSPLVLAFFITQGGAECRRQLDVIQRVQPRFPGVRFAAVAVRGNRSELRTLIRRRGWTFPIGYDRDGAVANLYGVAVCPTIVFTYPRRLTMVTDFGYLGEARLAERVRALEVASERRGWKPPR